MSRSFIYARVSTTDQNTENQIREIEAAGFAIDKRRIITESISGSVAASEPCSLRSYQCLDPSSFTPLGPSQCGGVLSRDQLEGASASAAEAAA